MAISAFTLAGRLRAGETVYSGWCGLPYPLVAETLARDGFAAVAIESQHGLWDVNGILAGIAAIRQGGAAPLVRVPFGDFALVSRVLDFGAEGVIYWDGTKTPPEIGNTAGEADTTLSLSLEDMEKLVSGDLSPTTAYMMGKLRIEGSMGVALKIVELLGE